MTGHRGTPMPQDHQMFDELAVGHALRALEPEDDEVFAAHLHDCSRCAETVAETSEVMADMATDLPVAEPSEGLRHRLRAAVAETEQVPAPTELRPVTPVARPEAGPFRAPATRRVTSQRWGRVLPTLVAASLAAVLGLGIWGATLISERQDLESTVAAQGAVMDALLDPGRATLAALGDDGRPVATVVPGDGTLEVVAHGLAANDADDTTYVVWGLRGDVPVPLGTFDVEGSQMALQTVGSGLTGLRDFDEYAVSLEPGQEAPSAPTDVVATGQVTS